MTENEIARLVVDAADPVHTRRGPGLLESVYKAVLAYELKKRGLRVQCQVPIPNDTTECALMWGSEPLFSSRISSWSN